LIGFKKELEALMSVEDSKALMRYFDFNAWIGSKLEQATFEEAIYRK
jgi:hypothetical protein